MADGLTGFPEWLPEQELVQQHVIATVRRQFELHGFTPLLTRSIEKVERPPETGRDGQESTPSSASTRTRRMRRRSRFTTTSRCPFARYTPRAPEPAHFPVPPLPDPAVVGGERPQHGRFREFLQADAGRHRERTLPLRFDAEMVQLLRSTLDASPSRPRRSSSTTGSSSRLLPWARHRRHRGTLRVVDKLAKIKTRASPSSSRSAESRRT